MPADWLAGLGLKLTGAAAGAGIATAYGFKRDGIITSLIRWLSGCWFGAFGTEKALMWLDWEATGSNTLFVASGIGLSAFIVIQIVLAERTREAFQKALGAVVAKRADK